VAKADERGRWCLLDRFSLPLFGAIGRDPKTWPPTAYLAIIFADHESVCNMTLLMVTPAVEH
jgi:hypothetical protein